MHRFLSAHVRGPGGERGAAAVEFALMLPVLLMLVLGLLEFSRVYNVQISLSNAAREGARVMAIHNDAAQARSAASAAAPSVSPAIASSDITVSPDTCADGSTVTVTIDYDIALMTGFFGVEIPLSGKGVMLCGG
ncbi:TadE/TadG family type IV pilus assembly protein [Luethyella okanaganae]|uniref:TadE/TadG family type IV pilus assembly protein n=1 Tax=Luethyella okanaganae TaxID=69372 RepID=A0ABW1VGI9_9MICO